MPPSDEERQAPPRRLTALAGWPLVLAVMFVAVVIALRDDMATALVAATCGVVVTTVMLLMRNDNGMLD